MLAFTFFPFAIFGHKTASDDVKICGLAGRVSALIECESVKNSSVIMDITHCNDGLSCSLVGRLQSTLAVLNTFVSSEFAALGVRFEPEHVTVLRSRYW